MEYGSYCPEVFAPRDLDHAKSIILLTDPTGEKWESETQHTVEEIISSFSEAGSPIGPRSVLLDFGCGVGRIARELIRRTDCSVIGTDISPGMLELSLRYVDSPKFIVCPRQCLPLLGLNGLRATGAFAIWTLQHCLDPTEDLACIAGLLKKGDPFFILNQRKRSLPVLSCEGWAQFVDDGIDIVRLLGGHFELLQTNPTPCSNSISLSALFRRIT